MQQLYIKVIPAPDLATFVKYFGDTFDISSWEERESSNYVNGEYYRGFLNELQIKVSLADNSEFSSFTFWIVLGNYEEESMDLLESMADQMARKLTLAGYEVVRSIDIGQINGKVLRYVKNPKVPGDVQTVEGRSPC